MTNHEIRGIAGQLFLILLSLLPMYAFSAHETHQDPAPPQEQPVESLPAEHA